ncbi:Gfo/Idh/MocA family oxidoreductase [Mollicutes bacterium LVI A0039]|nr:Gfo/Idh/MocA family oxidoreductase [Mollicutes bacterium LVI A0039]
MIKIGIIGSSSISEKFCLAVREQINEGHDIELHANYSRRMSTAQAFAAKFEIHTSYDNKVEMLKTVDLVYIATPNRMHYADVKLALSNNTHVLVEKPMTTTTAQTSELFDLAQDRNLVLVEAIKTCSMNTYQHILLNSNLIGDTTSFRLNMMRAYEHFPTADDPQKANVFRREMEGGVINDLGSYALFPLIDCIYPQTDVTHINFKPLISNFGLDVDTEAIISVAADNHQAHGLITLSMKNRDDSLSYIYGSSGYLTIDSISQFNHVKYYDLEHNLILDVKRDNSHLMSTELLHTIELIKTHQLQSNIHAHEKSLKVAALIEQIHKA